MFSRDFWLGENGAFVRAIRTAAQTAVATIGVGTTNLFSADIQNVAALSASAAILSLLMSFDRREALLAPSPKDTASADYQPTSAEFTGCGGQLR